VLVVFGINAEALGMAVVHFTGPGQLSEIRGLLGL
jgi:hypothetical protein